MIEDLSRLLGQIYEFGTDHDSKIKIHSEQFLNITPDTGLFLSLLIQAIKAKSILEIGTSNGYSTLWMADALRSNGGGKVTTVEASEKKAVMAKGNFQKSGLGQYIDLHLEDARVFLKTEMSESAELVFLDAERQQYTSYWNDVDRVVKTAGLLVVDNALSPKPKELVDFFTLVKGSGRYLAQVLQIGKGEMVALKQRKV